MAENQKKVLQIGRDEFSDTVEIINKELERINTIDIIETPDDKWFEQFVAAEMKKQENQFRRDVILFLLVAAAILSAIIFTLLEWPVLFLVLQGAAVIVTFFYTGKWLRKREGTA